MREADGSDCSEKSRADDDSAIDNKSTGSHWTKVEVIDTPIVPQ